VLSWGDMARGAAWQEIGLSGLTPAMEGWRDQTPFVQLPAEGATQLSLRCVLTQLGKQHKGAHAQPAEGQQEQQRHGEPVEVRCTAAIMGRPARLLGRRPNPLANLLASQHPCCN